MAQDRAANMWKNRRIPNLCCKSIFSDHLTWKLPEFGFNFFLIEFYNFQHNMWITEGVVFEYELLHLSRKLVGGLWVVGRKSFEQPLDQFCK